MKNDTRALTRKVTIKVQEGLYWEIDEEAKQKSITWSECARYRLCGSNINLEFLSKLCVSLTEIENIMRKYNLEEHDIVNINGLVRDIWEQCK